MMTEAEVRAIANEAAELAVDKLLVRLGIDPVHPLDAQADMQFLRSTRKRCEQAGLRAAMMMIALIIGGAVATFWKGFVGLFK